MPSAHWHPGAALSAVSATWTLQERAMGKCKADNAPPGILLMWVLRAPPESGLGSRQDVFNEPQCVSTVASQQPSSLLRTTRSGQWDGKPGGEFIKPLNTVSETANQTVDMIWGSSSGYHIVLLRVQVRNSLVLYFNTSSDFFPLLEFLSLTLTAVAIWPYPPRPQGGTAAVSHRRASSCRSNREKQLPSLSRYLQTAVMVQ